MAFGDIFKGLSGGGGNGSIIKSGYDVSEGVSGLSGLKSEFRDALSLNTSDANEGVLSHYSKMEGKYRGLNALLKRVSKAKLGAARGVAGVNQTIWSHANAAARLEVGWQQTTAKGLEGLSETLLDMSTAQESHAGFAEYCNKADKMITY